MIQQNFDTEDDDFNFSTHFSPYIEEKPEPEQEPEPEPELEPEPETKDRDRSQSQMTKVIR